MNYVLDSGGSVHEYAGKASGTIQVLDCWGLGFNYIDVDGGSRYGTDDQVIEAAFTRYEKMPGQDYYRRVN